MLTTVMRDVHEKTSSKETFYAHCIRVQTLVGGPYNYYLGISTGGGKPLGMITNLNGQVLRVWRRISAVEEYLDTMRDRMIGFGVIAPPIPVKPMADMLIRQYELGEKTDFPMLEKERKLILAALHQRRSASGRASDPPNA